MPYSTSLTFDQISLSQQVPVDPQLGDEAFELAFAEAENALQPLPVVEPEAVEEQSQLTEKEEGDRLAQTAGGLFETLKYKRDTDEKFRNSTFMALMKKLRDREVVVAGNDMVESSSLNEEATQGFN
jgi:peroxin-5